jgi:peptide methionine sulfoxide reductase msrA/msrB
MNQLIFALALGALLVGCTSDVQPAGPAPRLTLSESPSAAGAAAAAGGGAEARAVAEEEGLAIFAGGCFWCMEQPFEELPGVLSVTSGYTGGELPEPTYEAVCTGSTGHTEAIRIEFDPVRVDYGTLLEVFWRQIDPTDQGGQFVDRGSQYRSAIYYHSERQRELALASKQALERSGRFERPIVTEILPASEYYEAEEYHQDYHDKNPQRYERYRKGSGRERFLDAVWGAERELPVQGASAESSQREYRKPTDEELRERLTDLQYRVTQEAATERAFQNEFWDNHEEGLYVDVVSGEPLFSSRDKYDSGCGWPSFTRPLEAAKIKSQKDYKLGYAREEVRSGYGDSHLGHVFNDGPKPTGLRYCINSAALRFIPVRDLEREGLGEYIEAFRK